MLLQEILSFNEHFVENKEYAPREATKCLKTYGCCFLHGCSFN